MQGGVTDLLGCDAKAALRFDELHSDPVPTAVALPEAPGPVAPGPRVHECEPR